MKPFLIIALPRSMTAWMANWLTYSNCLCYHEGLETYGSLDALIDKCKGGMLYGDSSPALSVTSSDEIIEKKDSFNIGYIESDASESLESFKKVNPIPEKVSAETVINYSLMNIKKILKEVECFTISKNDIFNADKLKEFTKNLCGQDLFNKDRFDMLTNIRVTQDIEKIAKQRI